MASKNILNPEFTIIVIQNKTYFFVFILHFVVKNWHKKRIFDFRLPKLSYKTILNNSIIHHAKTWPSNY
jgi:hypothetical protein